MQVTSSCSIQYRFIKTTGSGLQEGARFIVHKTNEITFPWYSAESIGASVYELAILGACASQGIPAKSNNCLVLFLAAFKVTNASRGEGTEGEAPKSKACNFPPLPQRHFSAVAAAPGCHLPGMELARGQGTPAENPAGMETPARPMALITTSLPGTAGALGQCPAGQGTQGTGAGWHRGHAPQLPFISAG